ncbi:MAG: NUDIX hydrolase [Candidatus Micrarchaeia archaeon]|jgi:8-oxo-dGTP diphosphatase
MLKPELNAYAIVERSGKYLVMKRKNGIWEFPGGGIEKGEEPEKAAEREAREETGLKVKAGGLLCTTSAVFGRKYALYLVFSTLLKGGEAKISGEHAEMKWVSREELGKLALGYNARPVLDLI